MARECCSLLFLALLGILVLGSNRASGGRPDAATSSTENTNTDTTPSIYRGSSSRDIAKNRKLLGIGRRACTYTDISVSQRQDGSPGIPQYTVQIVNSCMSACAPRNIHLNCGWFASAPLVNPSVFKRLNYDDCLVNNGNPLQHGTVIRFTYSNSFAYPLKFKSASFC